MTMLRVTAEDFTVKARHDEPYDPEDRRSPIRVLKEWVLTCTDLPHVLAYEPFHIRSGVTAIETSAISIIGSLERWLDEENPYQRVATRQPVAIKRLVTDEVLKRLGLLLPGHHNRHINDATRHAVIYLASIKHLPMCRTAWPPRTSVRSTP